MTVRWGVLGPGRISHAFLRGVARSTETAAVAVASRDAGRAAHAAAEFGLARSYGSYAELLDDPEVDAVYIGLPNGLHAEWTVAAAKAGKHVLCEKVLAADAAEAAGMAAAAREHGVLLAEAFMYRFTPRLRRLAELVAAGAIGEVLLVRASFGFPLGDPDDVRLSAGLAGGSLRDVGCYPVNLARLAVGERPVRASALARWDRGVDMTLTGTLEYPSGAVAQIGSSLASGAHAAAQVIGSTGVLDLPDPFLLPAAGPALLVHRGGSAGTQTFTFDVVDQYQLEAEAVARAVTAGRAEVADQPLAETVENVATADALLAAARSGRVEPVTVPVP